MANDDVSEAEPVIGFITIEHVPELGHCGGLLLLNAIGRPIEFHCTAPVPENRAQRILYGRTYQTFLYCDQISLALTAKAKRRADILVTDCVEIIPLGRHSQAPVLCISNPEDQLETIQDPETAGFESGDIRFWSVESDRQQISAAQELCRKFVTSLPLDEPFERIRQAISEARTVAR
ncbi:MAG: hypothetical protein AAF456_24570 [Planctomycetota bacterium]